MREISLHILDLVQNSITAGAKVVKIEIIEDLTSDLFQFMIEDDGCGMSEEFLLSVTDPFTTTRTTRKVGMGISLTKAACESCGGSFEITSRLNVGTRLTAGFRHSHIDRQPLGDIAHTVSQLIMLNPDMDFIYTHQFNGQSFELSTINMREILEGVALNTPDVVAFISNYIEENLSELVN